MANIKELKKKIKSTKSTLKITTAMKLVSAAKMAKAQHAITSSRPFASELEETIRTVSAIVQDYDHPYLKESDNKQSVLLLISGHKGLCGGYNSQLAKEVRTFLNNSEEDYKVFYIGKKVKELIQHEVNSGKMFEFERTEPSFIEIEEVAKELAHMFETGEVGRVMVAYNVFHSAISFTPTVKQLLPMSLETSVKDEIKEKFPFDFKYDPNAKEILDTAIPQTYESTLWTCQLDALAAEHGSRMSAMDSASKNCKEAIRDLTLKANKLRQAAITTELIEVVSGAESLKG